MTSPLRAWGRPERRDQFDGLVAARAVSVTDGEVTFVVPDFDDGRYAFVAPLPGGQDPPPAGAQLVVAFLGRGAEDPRVLSWHA